MSIMDRWYQVVKETGYLDEYLWSTAVGATSREGYDLSIVVGRIGWNRRMGLDYTRVETTVDLDISDADLRGIAREAVRELNLKDAYKRRPKDIRAVVCPCCGRILEGE